MFVFVFAVPALLVVLIGYVAGYGFMALLGLPGAEPVGWLTGLLALAVAVRTGIVWWRRRRAAADGHRPG